MLAATSVQESKFVWESSAASACCGIDVKANIVASAIIIAAMMAVMRPRPCERTSRNDMRPVPLSLSPFQKFD